MNKYFFLSVALLCLLGTITNAQFLVANNLKETKMTAHSLKNSMAEDHNHNSALTFFKPRYMNSLEGFAVSANPLGFLQFGPIINLEYGVSEHIVLNGHIRFASLGLLSTIAMYDEDDDIFPDNLTGYGIGGGALYFFGDRQSKPYLGGLIEYHSTLSNYNMDSGNFAWDAESQMAVMVVNGGYRFRFDSGFFINTGAYLGAAIGDYDWYYTNPNNADFGVSNTSPDTFPFGMLELAFGIQF